MKYYIITLLGSCEKPNLHLFCSMWWPDGEEYSWTIGYNNLVVFERKSDAQRVMESVKESAVFKIEKVYIKGIEVHAFNPRFKFKK